MAKKTIFQAIDANIVIDLGIEEGVEYGVYSSSSLKDISTVIGTEDDTAFHKIEELLTTETTDQLVNLKKGFVLPGCGVSADRIKAACKEHSITLTNDYELADFIICEHQVSFNLTGSAESYPTRSLLVHWQNAIAISHDENHTNINELNSSFENYHNPVLYDKKFKNSHSLYTLEYESVPFDLFVMSGLALNLASLISKKELEVINIETILNASANIQVLTDELLEQMISMYNSGGEDREMLGTIIPTIDHTKTPALLWKLAQEIGNAEYMWSRNKDVKYWYSKSGLSDLYRHSAENAITKFISEGTMDEQNFKMLEPICREQIYISNRELYSFTVQVKPEYRKYLTKQKNMTRK
jgi:hypothetical protein